MRQKRRARIPPSGKEKSTQRTSWPLRWNGNAVDEGISTGYATLQPPVSVMLLRLGEVALAEETWTQWTGTELEDKQQNLYFSLSSKWIWSLFDRAVCAHMRGDDRLAWISARNLTKIRVVVEQELVAQKVPATGRNRVTGDDTEYLSFLEPLPALLADSERRVQEPSYVPVLKMPTAPKGSERVALLVRDLELISERQWSQPGGVNIAQSPIVLALIEINDEAVEPLLNCLEQDTRLTRSVSFGRDFSTYRTLLSVREAAYAALSNILYSDYFTSGSARDILTARSAEGRKAAADGIREYWTKYKGTTFCYRWYRTLADDKAGAQQWLQAATHIVQGEDVKLVRESSGMVTTSSGPRPPADSPRMQGEVLRAKSAPSVSELLVRRMNDQPQDGRMVDNRVAYAQMLAKWDGPAHLQDLRQVSTWLRDRWLQGSDNNVGYIVAAIVKVYEARVLAGDPLLVEEYAEWLSHLSPKNLDFTTELCFRIMWSHPDDPHVLQAAEEVFARPDSPWVPLLRTNGFHILRLLRSPLVGLKPVQVELLRSLQDKTTVGSVTLDAEGLPSIAVDNGWSGGAEGLAAGDPLAPPAGKLVTFRLCDLMASQLSSLPGAPACPLYRPEAERDKAVKKAVEFVQRFADLYRWQPGDQTILSPFDEAPIHLPRLDRPATALDVKAGRAIFALGGKARVVPLPTLPVPAVWMSLKEQRLRSYRLVGDHQVLVEAYQQKGKVYQAEEVQENGVWKRYYGFIGAGHIQQVSAAEIAFPSPYSAVIDGLEIKVLPPGKTETNGMVTFQKLDVSSALIARISARNGSGLDQRVAGATIQSSSADAPLPAPISLILYYSSKDEESARQDNSAWTTVPIKAGAPTAPGVGTAASLRPTEALTLATIDLKNYFRLERPGTYRLQVSVDDGRGTARKSDEAYFSISPGGR